MEKLRTEPVVNRGAAAALTSPSEVVPSAPAGAARLGVDANAALAPPEPPALWPGRGRDTAGYALLDFDGTLSAGYISMAFMDHLLARGAYDPAAYREQMRILAEHKAGTRSYDAWVDEWGRLWAAGLRGQHKNVIEQQAREFFAAYRANIYGPSKELVGLLGRSGVETQLLSAGVYEVVRLAAEELGADGAFGTQCRIVDGVYTGELATTVHTPTGKGELVARLEERRGRPLFAFGDSSGDVPMLERAKYPLCLNPNAELSALARARGWVETNTASCVEVIAAHPGLKEVTAVRDGAAAERPLPVIRFWAGYASTSVDDDQFMRGLQKVLIPDTTAVGAKQGLVGYMPVVLEGSTAKEDLPDEIALVVYYDEAHYQAIRATPNGARYGRNHFQLEGVSGIPGAEDLEGRALFTHQDGHGRRSQSLECQLYRGKVELGAAYSVLPDAYFDWVHCDAVTRIWRRDPESSDAAYVAAVKGHVAASRELDGITGYLLRVEGDYVLEYLLFDGGAKADRAVAGTDGSVLERVAQVVQTTRLDPLSDDKAQGKTFPLARGRGYRLVFDPGIEELEQRPAAPV